MSVRGNVSHSPNSLTTPHAVEEGEPRNEKHGLIGPRLRRGDYSHPAIRLPCINSLRTIHTLWVCDYASVVFI
ncbi:hypothetical protein BDW72DRAFT_168774 [Aspergillus terricola var. indicus]